MPSSEIHNIQSQLASIDRKVYEINSQLQQSNAQMFRQDIKFEKFKIPLFYIFLLLLIILMCSFALMIKSKQIEIALSEMTQISAAQSTSVIKSNSSTRYIYEQNHHKDRRIDGQHYPALMLMILGLWYFWYFIVFRGNLFINNSAHYKISR